MDKLKPGRYAERVMAKNVNGCINPSCCQYGNNVYIYYVDDKNTLVEIKQNGKELSKRFVNSTDKQKYMLKAVNDDKINGLSFYVC